MPYCDCFFTSSSHIWLWYSILDSLILQLQSDRVLVKSLNPSEPLRHLYIYESTMSLLTRLAMSAQGASALLNSALMSKLSECSVYDARPNISHRRWESSDCVQCNHWSHLYGANVKVHLQWYFAYCDLIMMIHLLQYIVIYTCIIWIFWVGWKYSLLSNYMAWYLHVVVSCHFIALF